MGVVINNNFSCLPSWWSLLCGGAYYARAHLCTLGNLALTDLQSSIPLAFIFLEL